jgi:hypothetical protein
MMATDNNTPARRKARKAAPSAPVAPAVTHRLATLGDHVEVTVKLTRGKSETIVGVVKELSLNADPYVCVVRNNRSYWTRLSVLALVEVFQPTQPKPTKPRKRK